MVMKLLIFRGAHNASSIILKIFCASSEAELISGARSFRECIYRAYCDRARPAGTG